MFGFMRLIRSEASGSFLSTLQDDELLGMLVGNTTVAGAGDAHVYENNANGTQIAHVVEGQNVTGPFQHSSKNLWVVVVGTSFAIDVYAWKNPEYRRSQF
jgi:hypothetical protein